MASIERQARRLKHRMGTGGSILGLGAMALAAAAVVVNERSSAAQQRFLPRGKFITVDGVRLHYVEGGERNARAVVFLHGNGATTDDLAISGVLDRTAERFRVIAFDRPGFGHSDRPHGRSWSAQAQAALLLKAFEALGIQQPIVVGHSWGCLVAAALAIEHPHAVGGLVLASGYFFPTERIDAALFALPALPVAGFLMRHTTAPIVGEAIAPFLIKKIFAPRDVSERFKRDFPIALCLRPSQIRAFAEDNAHMISSAKALSGRYRQISCPVAILTGDSDEVVDFRRQSQRLHAVIASSTLQVEPGVGHMLHHADPDGVAATIADVAAEAREAEFERVPVPGVAAEITPTTPV